MGGRFLTHEEYIEKVGMMNPHLTVVGRYVRSSDKITVRCNIDGYTWKSTAGHFAYKKCECPICLSLSGRAGHRHHIWAGVNDLATLRPDVARYLKDPSIGSKLMRGRQVAEFICPNCGDVTTRQISRVCTHGFYCVKCSDGLSYPERFIHALFKQQKIVYEYHKEFDWSKKPKRKIYDFYISERNIIIETHGLQHYYEQDMFFKDKSIKELKHNDIVKYNLAIANEVSEYIVLDCRYSDPDFIKNSILNSPICSLLDIDKIDWTQVAIEAEKSFVIESANLWNRGYLTRDVAKELNISEASALRYLKRAKQLSLCNFKMRLFDRIICNETQEIFDTIIEAQKYHNVSNIRDHLGGRYGYATTKGKTWRKFDITKDKFLDYKHISL